MFEELALSDVDRSALDDSQLIDLLVARSRQLAHVQAQFLADLVAVAEREPEPEFAAMEIAAALTWTRQAAGNQLMLAQQVVNKLPMVHSALAAGVIDLPKAWVIVEGVSGLDPAAAREVAARILPQAPSLTTGKLRARLSKLVIETDPQAAAVRQEMRVKDRRVVLEPDRDGYANLCGFDLPPSESAAAYQRLTDLAHQAKQAGDARTVDQLRADTMLDLLLSRSDGQSAARGGGVEITAPLATLVGLAQQPGDLAGYGPVVADIARQVAAQQQSSPWKFTVHDPATGNVFTGITRRRPSAAMARHVTQRDRTCRAPGCRVPAHRADLDHTVAWEDGGITHPDNLGVLCRYHHRAKHEGRWQVHQPQPGHFVWHSPLGRTYHIKPEPP